ncbi:hypothetical protein BHE74_00033095 [Ensete ventricosum]|nr:hypothetical protein BHE74_00033095 [Ensete ventricosum]
MPPQDQAPVKDADLEHMPMNLKEGDRYVVNHGEDMTVVDFGGHSAVESCKRVEPERTPQNQLRDREEEGLVGWRLLCRKRAGPVAEAAGQQQNGAVGSTRHSELQEPEGTPARGRSGWSEIRLDDSKHRLLRLRSQCPTKVDPEPLVEVSIVGLDVKKPALFLYDQLELPKKQAAARVSRLRSMVVMQRVAGAEAAVAGGTTEKGRMISPPKDNDERPQEGAMCGRWGGAVDRLPRKIGDNDCDGSSRKMSDDCCSLWSSGNRGHCRRKQIASSNRGPRLRLKKRAMAVAEEERRELSFGSTVAQATATGDGGMRRQQDEALSTAVEESGRLGQRPLGVDGRPLEIKTLVHSKSASQEATVSRLRVATVAVGGSDCWLQVPCKSIT